MTNVEEMKKRTLFQCKHSRNRNLSFPMPLTVVESFEKKLVNNLGHTKPQHLSAISVWIVCH